MTQEEHCSKYATIKGILAVEKLIKGCRNQLILKELAV
jgi:hypothetical protein